MKRVFIAVEDTYARNALKLLIQHLFKQHQLRIDIHSLRPCSSKMTRILKASILDENIVAVIVLVDSETKKPVDVIKEIYSKHLMERDKSYVIALRPCIEEWPCTILGLKNCNTAPCSMGPARSINEYWVKEHGRGYRKRFLVDVFREMLKQVRIESVDKPSTLKEFIEILSSILVS